MTTTFSYFPNEKTRRKTRCSKRLLSLYIIMQLYLPIILDSMTVDVSCVQINNKFTTGRSQYCKPTIWTYFGTYLLCICCTYILMYNVYMVYYWVFRLLLSSRCLFTWRMLIETLCVCEVYYGYGLQRLLYFHSFQFVRTIWVQLLWYITFEVIFNTLLSKSYITFVYTSYLL